MFLRSMVYPKTLLLKFEQTFFSIKASNRHLKIKTVEENCKALKIERLGKRHEQKGGL